MVQILSDFLKNEYRPEAHIIGRGILPVGGKLILSGSPKANKSFVALNIMLDLVRGRHIFGAQYKDGKPLLPVQKPWRVLYLEQELGEQGLLERMRGRDEGHPGLTSGIDPDGLQLFVQPRDTKMRLDHPDGRIHIRDIVKSIMPDVTIMDPFAKFNLLDENSSQDMGAIMRVADHLVEDFGTAIIFVHHIGKQSTENPRRGLDRLRGSSAIAADVDTMIEVSRRSPENSLEPILELTFELRRGEPIEHVFVQRAQDGWVQYMGEDYQFGGGHRDREAGLPRAKYKDL